MAIVTLNREHVLYFLTKIFSTKFAGVGNVLNEKKKVTLFAILVPNILVLLHFLLEVPAENWLVLVEYTIDSFCRRNFMTMPTLSK